MTDAQIASALKKTLHAVKKMRQRKNLDKSWTASAVKGDNMNDFTFLSSDACQATGTPDLEESAQADLNLEDKDLTSIIEENDNGNP